MFLAFSISLAMVLRNGLSRNEQALYVMAIAIVYCVGAFIHILARTCAP